MKKLFLGLALVLGFSSMTFADDASLLDRDDHHRPHRPPHVRCWARDHRGVVFEGFARLYEEARHEALERCQKANRHHHRHERGGCHISRCTHGR